MSTDLKVDVMGGTVTFVSPSMKDEVHAVRLGTAWSAQVFDDPDDLLGNALYELDAARMIVAAARECLDAPLIQFDPSLLKLKAAFVHHLALIGEQPLVPSPWAAQPAFEPPPPVTKRRTAFEPVPWNPCDCELRNRQWNGFGKCLTCSGSYIVTSR
jgi:hypothetical protein